MFFLSGFPRSSNLNVFPFRDFPKTPIRVVLPFGISPKLQSERFSFSGFSQNSNPSGFAFRDFPEAPI